jgi:glutaminyl-tRNA synthetase
MRAGEFAEGQYVLRARIDMAAPNLNLRDPVLYRILKAHHPRTGDRWCIYPMYDWAHGQSDAIEGITHSICTLEFENHRPLYDWFLDNLPVPHRPRQYEFARLNLLYTVMSKRKLLQLVNEKRVEGWDDPRMPTLAGFRRRGYTPEAIRAFCDRIGVAKRESWVDPVLLENAIRDDLNTKVRRAMCVLRPLKVVIENLPAGQVEELEAPFYPDDPPKMGSRRVPFTREIYIERDDFMEDPPKKFFRLAPGREVRLRWGFFIRCERVVHDDAGHVVELRCSYDPATRGGNAPDGRKVKGTIHWVSATHSAPVQVRLYDRLFTVEQPDAGKDADFRQHLNPESLIVLDGARAEGSLQSIAAGERVQFERQGYYYVDPRDSRPGAPVFHRIVTLKDTWAKMVAKGEG